MFHNPIVLFALFWAGASAYVITRILWPDVQRWYWRWRFRRRQRRRL